MIGNALISACGTYRYTLDRYLVGDKPDYTKPVLFFLLNPSVADAKKKDPTAGRCIEFALREGGTYMVIANLFALRSPDPKSLLGHPDPVGPDNDKHINMMVNYTRMYRGVIIAGWGTNKFAKARAKHVIEKYGPFKCLGKNKDGSPRHPLYVPGDYPLEDL